MPVVNMQVRCAHCCVTEWKSIRSLLDPTSLRIETHLTGCPVNSAQLTWELKQAEYVLVKESALDLSGNQCPVYEYRVPVELLAEIGA